MAKRYRFDGFNDEYDYDNPEFYQSKHKRREKRYKRRERDDDEEYDEWG